VKPLEYYLDGIYETEIIEEHLPESDLTIYLARLKNFPRCSAQGSSAQQALERLQYIKDVMIKSRHERGVDPPEPDHHRE